MTKTIKKNENTNILPVLMPLFNSYQKAYSDLIQNELPKELVYHYTNLNGLDGILSSQQLYLTHYKTLNDPSEIELAHSEVVKYIESLNKNFSDKAVWNFFIKKIYETVTILDIFVFSFCLRKDYLPAWRWYGDDAKGYSIGFNLDSIKYSEIPEPRSDTIVLCKVQYKIDYFKDYLNRIINSANRHSIKRDTISKRFKKKFDIDLMATTASYIIPIIPSIKHPAYQEECEYRFFKSEYTNEFLDSHSSIQAMLSNENKGIHKNKPIAIQKFERHWIKEIWMGPSSDFAKESKRIKNILNNNGYDVNKIDIIESDIPYITKHKD